MRVALFGACLILAAALVVYGVSLWSLPSAFIAAGVFVASIAWFLIAEVDAPAPSGDA